MNKINHNDLQKKTYMVIIKVKLDFIDHELNPKNSKLELILTQKLAILSKK
jgi:hypothetical protein